MFDEKDIHIDLPFSADEGWAAMQLLLNKKLPVRKRNRVPGLLYAYLPAFVLSALCILSSLQLNKNISSLSATLSVSQNIAGDNSSVFAEHKGNVANNQFIPQDITNEAKLTVNKDDINIITEKHTDISETTNQLTRITVDSIIQYKHENMLAINTPEVVCTHTQTYFPMVNVHRKKTGSVKAWEFSAGIGMNMAAGKHQNLQPYPIAEVTFNLNSTFFIGAGLSFFSPAPADVSGISKTIYVNDTANNIRLYNEKTGYVNLRYADVPIYAGIKLSKRVFLQGGIQASVLLTKSENKSLYPYDFRMNSIEGTSVTPAGITANSQEHFDVGVRKIDCRFIAGVKYKFPKITASLMYQQGLRSAGVGINTSKNNNQLFTASLLYNIR